MVIYAPNHLCTYAHPTELSEFVLLDVFWHGPLAETYLGRTVFLHNHSLEIDCVRTPPCQEATGMQHRNRKFVILMPSLGLIPFEYRHT